MTPTCCALFWPRVFSGLSPQPLWDGSFSKSENGAPRPFSIFRWCAHLRFQCLLTTAVGRSAHSRVHCWGHLRIRHSWSIFSRTPRLRSSVSFDSALPFVAVPTCGWLQSLVSFVASSFGNFSTSSLEYSQHVDSLVAFAFHTSALTSTFSNSLFPFSGPMSGGHVTRCTRDARTGEVLKNSRPCWS